MFDAVVGGRALMLKSVAGIHTGLKRNSECSQVETLPKEPADFYLETHPTAPILCKMAGHGHSKEENNDP